MVCFRIGWALIGAVSRTSTARKSHGLGGRAEKCNISMFASPFDDDDRKPTAAQISENVTLGI